MTDYGDECGDVVAERDSLRAENIALKDFRDKLGGELRAVLAEVAELRADYKECSDSRVTFMLAATELREKWAAIPWDAIEQCGMIAIDVESMHEDAQLTMGFVWANRLQEPQS